jgi:inosine-uridine nucleoside N-ribohydrolase
MRMPHAMLIDIDTASDDAVALIMAMRSPEVRVIAITTVAGNVPLEQATRNALYVAQLCDSPAPVFPGARQPSGANGCTPNGSTARTVSATAAIRFPSVSRSRHTPPL